MKPAIRLCGMLFVLLAFIEGGLRVSARGPWTAFETFAAAPRISDPDAELGWVNRPGRYRYPAGDGTVGVRIDAHGRRGGLDGPGDVGLFGGSFMFGFGVEEAETVGGRLGSGVRTHAVPGYGTLQSVLAYERLESPPPTVVYGLVGLHDARNAAVWSWTRALERSARDGNWGAVPSAWWDGEALQYGAPAAYRHWPWSETFALVDLVERARNAVRDRFWRTKSETTVRLVQRFRDAVTADGGRFVVALLDAPDRDAFFLERFATLDIECVDLRHPQVREWVVVGDGHPDARIHAYWADALEGVL